MNKYYYGKLINSIKWWEKLLLKLLLKFKRRQYKIICEGLYEVQVTYKILFNKKFILKKVEIPPQHFNCRCKVVGTK